jgi:poly(3-hydroxybutyrate) depolymerase
MMKLKPILALSAALAAIATVASTKVDAYTVLGYTWAQSPVPYYINSANMDLPPENIEPAIRAGADAWRLQSGASFAFAFAGYSTQTTNTNDGINLVMFRNASSGSAIATTYTWFSGSRMIDADMVFWDAGFQFFTGSSGCSAGFYIEDVATHEFGHALGLGHSTTATATMYPSISTCSQQSRSLDADDIAGVLALYPATATPPTPPTGLRIIK